MEDRSIPVTLIQVVESVRVPPQAPEVEQRNCGYFFGAQRDSLGDVTRKRPSNGDGEAEIDQDFDQ
jgi:hypothetical protein